MDSAAWVKSGSVVRFATRPADDEGLATPISAPSSKDRLAHLRARRYSFAEKLLAWNLKIIFEQLRRPSRNILSTKRGFTGQSVGVEASHDVLQIVLVDVPLP